MNFFINILLFFVCIFPKINIISFGTGTTGIRIEDLFVLICGIILLLNSFKNKKISFPMNMSKIIKIFFLYIFISFFSCVYGIANNYVSPITSFLYLFRKVEYFIFIFFGYFYKKNSKLENYYNFIVIFHFVCCILQMVGIIGSFNHGEMLTTLTQGRVSSTFNGAYELSAFLLILLPYYLDEVFNKKNKIAINWLFIFIIIFCIYISQSRTSLIVALIIILLNFFQSKTFKKKKYFQNFIIVLIVIVIPTILLNYKKIDLSRFEMLDMKKTIYIFKYTWKYKNFNLYVRYGNWYGNSPYSLNKMDSLGYDGSLYQRTSHWMQLIDGWLTSPLIGLGTSISGGSADGNYLRILIENGILGLSIWIFLIVKIYADLKKSKTYIYLKYSFLTIILGSILIDLFESSKIMMLFWFLIGLYYRECEKDD